MPPSSASRRGPGSRGTSRSRSAPPGRAPRRAGESGRRSSQAEPPARTTTPVARRIGVLLIVLLVLVISYSSSLRAWLQQRDQLTAARADIVNTQAKVAALKEQKQRWHDPAYIEQQARIRFSWVLPGETGYRVIGADGKPLGRQELSRAPSAAKPATSTWYAKMWGSVEAAGAQPKTHVTKKHTPTKRVIKPGRSLLPHSQ